MAMGLRVNKQMIEPAGPEAEVRPRMLVLGLGNPLLGDDSAGLRVVQKLRSRLSGRPDVEVDEDYWGGLRLMERMIGFDRVVVVDAMCSAAAPGTVRVLSPDAVPTRHSTSAHDTDLCTALELGRRTGAKLPTRENIRLVAIEAADVLAFSERCTPEVDGGIERAVEVVLSLLAAWR
jgi:hydrogenase maturation protease